MASLGHKDALWLALVVATMVTVMGTIMAILASGLDNPNLQGSLRTGLVAGFSTFAMVGIFALARVRTLSDSEKNPAEIKKQELERARAILSVIEVRAGEDSGNPTLWQVSEKIYRERGVLCVDLHGLNAPQSAALTEKLLERREDFGRIRLITGRGEILHENSADPGIRPVVLQRLQIGARKADWQVIIRSGSVVLRPSGVAPTAKIWLTRFGIFVIPMTGIMALAFRDLAGSGFAEQGTYFGIGAGILMTILVASHRDRSA